MYSLLKRGIFLVGMTKTYYTFEEFSQKIENIQKDKNGKTVILYTNVIKNNIVLLKQRKIKAMKY